VNVGDGDNGDENLYSEWVSVNMTYETCNTGRIADTDTYDGAVSSLLQLENSDILLFYRQSDGDHRDPSARVAMLRSSDYGETWSDPQTVHDVPRRDTGEPSVVYDQSTGRITLFTHAMKLCHTVDHTHPAVESTEAYQMSSTDGGVTWSEPTRITDELLVDNPWPFGDYVRTSRGLMTQFYSRWDVEVMFSSDGGKSWTDNQLVFDSTESDRLLSEPSPCAITEQKIILFGREQSTGEVFAFRSDNGGKSWDDPVFFNPTGGSTPCPIRVNKTNRNEITAVWGDRDDGFVYAATMSAELAWQDPSLLEEEPKKRIHRQAGQDETASYWDGLAGDFGYATMVKSGPSPHESLVVFYDEGPKPNLWRMPLY
jgi:hypothetical protein